MGLAEVSRRGKVPTEVRSCVLGHLIAAETDTIGGKQPVLLPETLSDAPDCTRIAGNFK
jgi:hypothetical protein